VEAPSAGSCCGSAGSYSLLNPRDSARVLAPKLDEIEALRWDGRPVDYVVAVNPGCLLQLKVGLARRRSPIRAVHLADLLVAAERGRPLPGPTRLARRDGAR
jgi:glycolate oxidase iron-sulfur subunit